MSNLRAWITAFQRVAEYRPQLNSPHEKDDVKCRRKRKREMAGSGVKATLKSSQPYTRPLQEPWQAICTAILARQSSSMPFSLSTILRPRHSHITAVTTFNFTQKPSPTDDHVERTRQWDDQRHSPLGFGTQCPWIIQHPVVMHYNAASLRLDGIAPQRSRPGESKDGTPVQDIMATVGTICSRGCGLRCIQSICRAAALLISDDQDLGPAQPCNQR